MYARVVRWENGKAEAIEEAVGRISQDAGSGPPEGVPAKGLVVLTDPKGGKAIAISFFETEADYREGDETLNAMSPPGEGMGSRVAVEKYEVAVEIDV